MFMVTTPAVYAAYCNLMKYFSVDKTVKIVFFLNLHVNIMLYFPRYES